MCNFAHAESTARGFSRSDIPVVWGTTARPHLIASRHITPPRLRRSWGDRQHRLINLAWAEEEEGNPVFLSTSRANIAFLACRFYRALLDALLRICTCGTHLPASVAAPQIVKSGNCTQSINNNASGKRPKKFLTRGTGTDIFLVFFPLRCS